jgi:hypothetical protein
LTRRQELPAGPRRRTVTVLPAEHAPLTGEQEGQAIAALAILLADQAARHRRFDSASGDGDRHPESA